jgi:16S rRNA (guanine(966)-N(2))-methyltransferase RsmD
MRIISGTYKGKRLQAPKSLPVRPTTDFAKEALFNILNHEIDFSEVTMLDLFSGTGNIAYEFASRGCQNVTAVDEHYGCVKFISQTAEALDFPIQTIKADVNKYVRMSNGTFDVIFADPPYTFTVEEIEKIILDIFQNNLLSEDGFLIIEHSKHKDLAKVPHFERSRKYGGSVFSFFI